MKTKIKNNIDVDILLKDDYFATIKISHDGGLSILSDEYDKELCLLDHDSSETTDAIDALIEGLQYAKKQFTKEKENE